MTDRVEEREGSTECGNVFFHGGPHGCPKPKGHEGQHDCGPACPSCVSDPQIARAMGKTIESLTDALEQHIPEPVREEMER